jgi:hypothetical protein
MSEKSHYSTETEIALIKQDIETIKNNHLHHIEKDIAEMKQDHKQHNTMVIGGLGSILLLLLGAVVLPLLLS